MRHVGHAYRSSLAGCGRTAFVQPWKNVWLSRRHRANPRWNGPIFRHERRGARYEAPEAAQCEQQGVAEGIGAALEAARRPDAEQLPHEQPEIQAADLQEQALEDVAVSAQVHAAHPSGCVEMRIGTFEAFTAPTQ